MLQRSAGNAAVAALIRSTTPVVQRRSPPTESELTWTHEDSSRDQAELTRTTNITATTVGDAGPMPPRVSYDRQVELRSPDGIEMRLKIGVTIHLPPGTPLPTTEAAALRIVGRGISGGRYLTVSVGDAVTFGEHRHVNEPRATSLTAFAADFPEYALLPLTARQQEAALLRKLASLPRRPAAGDAGTGTGGPGPGGATKPTVTERVRQAVDMATDFIPGVSNVKDFVTFLTGVNPVTGEKVGWGQRILALIFSIPGVGTLFKGIGRGLKALGARLLGPLLRLGMRIAAKSKAMVKWLAKSKWAVVLGKAGRGAWHRARERAGRLAERLGLRQARVGHDVPWATMSKKQRKAFQHSYSNHGKDFGLPKWSEKSAESLRQQFNAAAANVRQNAQRIDVRYKPVNGVTEPVRYFGYVDSAGTRWYYFETLKGKFVSAGLEVR